MPVAQIAQEHGTPSPVASYARGNGLPEGELELRSVECVAVQRAFLLVPAAGLYRWRSSLRLPTVRIQSPLTDDPHRASLRDGRTPRPQWDALRPPDTGPRRACTDQHAPVVPAGDPSGGITDRCPVRAPRSGFLKRSVYAVCSRCAREERVQPRKAAVAGSLCRRLREAVLDEIRPAFRRPRWLRRRPALHHRHEDAPRVRCRGERRLRVHGVHGELVLLRHFVGRRRTAGTASATARPSTRAV